MPHEISSPDIALAIANGFGNVGQVLTSQGTDADFIWQDVTTATGGITQPQADARYVQLSGAAPMSGPLILYADPTAANGAATKHYVDMMAAGFQGITQGQADARYVQLTGAVAMSGPLTLSGDPTTALGAATKQYVDAHGSANAPVQSVAGKQGTVTLQHTDITDWTAATANLGLVQSVAGRTGNVVLGTADIAGFTPGAAAAAPVQSVAGKTGTVTLTTTDIIGFGTVAAAAAPVQSVAGRIGAIVLSAADIANFNSAAAAVAPVQAVAGRGGSVVLSHTDITDWNAATANLGKVTSVAGKIGDVTLVPTDIVGFGTAVAAAAPVTSVAGRIGAIVLSAADITNFSTAVVAAAPVTSVAGKTGVVSLVPTDIANFVPTAAGAAPVQAVSNRTGSIVLTHADITDWAAATANVGVVQSVAGKTGNVLLGTGDIAGFNAGAALAAPVQTVSGRTGNVTIAASDVIGFGTSAAASAPVQFVAGKQGNVTIVAADVSGFAPAAAAAAPIQSVSGRTGTITLTHADITDWTTALNSGAPVQSVAGKTGAVTLTAADIVNFGSAVVTNAPVQTVAGKFGAVTLTSTDIVGFSTAAATAAPVQSVAGRGAAVVLTHADITDWSTITASYGLVVSVSGRTGAISLTSADLPDFNTAARAAAPVQTVSGRVGTITLSHLDLIDWNSATAAFTQWNAGTVTTIGANLLLNAQGTLSGAAASVQHFVGNYNAVTNTPSLGAGGTGVGGGVNGNTYVVQVAGTVVADAVGPVAISDQIVNNGSLWIRLPAGSVYGSMAIQNANNVSITAGSVTGLSALGFANGDSMAPANLSLPDFAEITEDAFGNVAEALDYSGQRIINRAQIQTLAVPGTATIQSFTSSGTAITNTLTVAAGASSFQAGNPLVPDLVEYTMDAFGNIVEGIDALGTKVLSNLKVLGTTTSTPVAPGSVSRAPGDSLNIADVKYGGIGDGCDDIYSGVWTNGGTILTLGKYSGAATWGINQPLVLSGYVSGVGRGFEPFDVGSAIYVQATDGSGVVTTGTITGWNSNVSVNVSPNPSTSVTAANLVWPAFTAAHVGKTIRVEGGALSSARQSYNNGLVPWVGTIVTVPAGNQVTVTGVSPAFSTVNVGTPTRVSWGTDNSKAYYAVNADCNVQGKKVVWHPAIYGKGKTVYCAFGLAAAGTGETVYTPYSGDTLMMFSYGSLIGDESVVSVLTDSSGRELYRRVIPWTAPAAIAPRRDLIGRVHLPRLGATATPNVMECGDSIARYDPTGQSLAWGQVNLFESNIVLDNPGKTFSFTNSGVTGLGFWEMVDPASGLPWLIANQDVYWVASHGRNDAWRIHPLPMQTAINAILGQPADTHGNLPGIIFTSADTESQSPAGQMGMTHDAVMFSQMLIRSMARVNKIGLVDFSWPSEQAVQGTDEMHREFIQVPLVATPFTLSAVSPFQMMTELNWFSMSVAISAASGSAMWAAMGQLMISLSPMPGNVVVLDSDPVSGLLRVEPRVWGNSCATTVTTSGNTLTTASGTTSTGTLVWQSNNNQLTHSGAPFTGTAGRCILMSNLGTNGAPERSFIRLALNSTTAVVDDFWWGNAGGAGVTTYNAASTVAIGGMQFIPSDATALVDIVMTWGTSTYRGKITGYTGANQVTVSPTPPALSGQAVTFWLGKSLGQKTLTGFGAGVGGPNQNFALSLQGTELSMGLNNLAPNIFRGHVGRFGNKFCPQISVNGPGSVTITLNNLYADRPVYYSVVGSPYALFGSGSNAAIGGGGGPHPASLQAVRTTQRTMDAADFCAN